MRPQLHLLRDYAHSNGRFRGDRKSRRRILARVAAPDVPTLWAERLLARLAPLDLNTNATEAFKASITPRHLAARLTVEAFAQVTLAQDIPQAVAARLNFADLAGENLVALRMTPRTAADTNVDVTIISVKFTLPLQTATLAMACSTA
jgi:hypothetical protein